MAQYVSVADRSLLSTSSDESDVVESQHGRTKSNSISHFIYARLDVIAQHCRYQRHEFVSFPIVIEIQTVVLMIKFSFTVL